MKTWAVCHVFTSLNFLQFVWSWIDEYLGLLETPSKWERWCFLLMRVEQRLLSRADWKFWDCAAHSSLSKSGTVVESMHLISSLISAVTSNLDSYLDLIHLRALNPITNKMLATEWAVELGSCGALHMVFTVYETFLEDWVQVPKCHKAWPNIPL